jgi:hypothetical protein
MSCLKRSSAYSPTFSVILLESQPNTGAVARQIQRPALRCTKLEPIRAPMAVAVFCAAWVLSALTIIREPTFCTSSRPAVTPRAQAKT